MTYPYSGRAPRNRNTPVTLAPICQHSQNFFSSLVALRIHAIEYVDQVSIGTSGVTLIRIDVHFGVSPVDW